MALPDCRGSPTQDFDACLAAAYSNVASLTAALVELQAENGTLRRHFQQLHENLPALLEAARQDGLREKDNQSVAHASVVAELHQELVSAHEALQSREPRAGPNLRDMGEALTAAHAACASLLAETDDLKAQLAACRAERDAAERAERQARVASQRVSQAGAAASSRAPPAALERAQDTASAVSPLGVAAAGGPAAIRAPMLEEDDEPPEASALRAFSRHAKR
jgi:cell division protein FtsB